MMRHVRSVTAIPAAFVAPPPARQPSSDVFCTFVPASISFFERADDAFSSTGVYPAATAHRCAADVFPIPGGPVISTARNTPIASFPGFLKPERRLASLHTTRQYRTAKTRTGRNSALTNSGAT
jgi:hypothetical protein